MKNKLVAVGVLTCALSGFGLGLLEMPREAEAALLPNPPSPVVEVQEVEIAEPVKLYTQADVEMLARLIYTEARGGCLRPQGVQRAPQGRVGVCA